MKNSIELDFNGTKLTFFYGLSFLGSFLKDSDLDLQDIYNNINSEPFSFIPNLMFESYKHNCERNNKVVEINKLQLTDLIEQTNYFKDDGVSTKFIEAFLGSILDTLPKQESNDKQSVKKK